MAGGDAGEEGGGYYPKHPWLSVSHYYGDYVRQFLLGAAALMLFAAPFYGEFLRAELPFVVMGTLVLVALAAITNPWKKSIMTADAVASGTGLLIFETWAIYGYGESTALAFVLRQALALIFLVAFYFSVKTVRAMLLHQLGKRDTSEEFAGEEYGPSRSPRKIIPFLSRFKRRPEQKEGEFLHHKPHGE